MWVLQEAMAVLLLVLKYPALNLVPETGAWIIGDGENASRLGNFRYASRPEAHTQISGGKYEQECKEGDADSISRRTTATAEGRRRHGLRVLRTPYRSPQANAFCERLIGSARRECLDFMIPFDEDHIRQILKLWVAHYKWSRPTLESRTGISRPKRPEGRTPNQGALRSEGLPHLL
jgi:Integrase core domain